MNILVLTSVSTFPSRLRPMAGCFFGNLMKHICRLGHRAVVIAPTAWIPWGLRRVMKAGPPVPAMDTWEGIPVCHPPYLSLRATRRMGLQSRHFAAAALPPALEMHRRDAFNVVVGYGFGIPPLVSRLVADELGLRCVCWAIGSDVHTVPFRSNENMLNLRRNVRRCDLVLTEAEDLRNRILRICPKARNIHTYYKGIELEALRSSPDKLALRRELGLRPDRTYMLSAGSADAGKGVHEFYQALRSLSADKPDLSGVWVGGGGDGDAIVRQARADGLGDRLTVTGVVERNVVLAYMQATDVMAFPSHAEGLPNVVMEALAAGLPTVATDVGGTNEVLVDGVTGLLVPPRDAASLKTAVRRLLDHPVEANVMASRGRQLVFDHFDVARNAAVAVDILRHVMDGGAVEAPVPACAGVEAGVLPWQHVQRLV